MPFNTNVSAGCLPVLLTICVSFCGAQQKLMSFGGCQANDWGAALCEPKQKRLVALAPSEIKEFDKYPKLAIVVGVGAYSQTGFAQLDYAAKDALDMGKTLGQLGYVVCTLTDGAASLNLLKQKLQEVEDTLDPKDGTIIFYFSGHGFALGGNNYLATSDTSLSNLEKSGIKVSEVQATLERSGARRLVMWMDACRNNPVRGSKGDFQFAYRKYEDSKGTKILYATQAGEVSWEDPKLQHGVFTSYLLGALAGHAKGQDGLLLFSDVARYVIDGVQEYGFGNGKTQRPTEAGESSGEFMLARSVGIQVDSSLVEPQPPSADHFMRATKELRDRWAELRERADAMNTRVDELSKRNEQNGFAVRPAIILARNKMNTRLDLAKAEIWSDKFSDATQTLNVAKGAIQELESLFGK
jgi:hypothetical protein